MTSSTTAGINTNNNLKTNYIINIFNTPQTACINNSVASNPRSPTPSGNSENSIECSMWAPHQPSDVASTTSEDTEQDLTSLTWLTELRNQSLAWPDSVRPILDDDEYENDNFVKCNVKLLRKNNGVTTIDKQNESSGINLIKNPTPSERYNSFIEKLKRDVSKYEASATVYQNDSSTKPPFNYSHIIGMSIIENGRMTLQQICSSIETKFAYFRVRKKWNNSIRHNLSLHPCFRKIDRSKNEKGKGGYWELGVDLRKCDRKRIRNRKTKLDHTRGDHESNIIRCAFENANETYDQIDNSLMTTMSIDQDIQKEEIVQDQLMCHDDELIMFKHQKYHEMQYCDDVLLQNLNSSEKQIQQQHHYHYHNHNRHHNHNRDQQQHLTVTVTSAAGHYDMNDLAVCSNPIQLQDVFITGIDNDTYGISSTEEAPIAMATSTTSETVTTKSATAIASSSNKMPLELFSGEYQTGAIIHSARVENGVISINDDCDPSSNCFQDSSTNNNQKRMEPEISQDCESVVVPSFLNNSPLNGPNVIVEQLPSYYTGSLVDEGNTFRPYSDGIDEAFQYLQSSEYRCDDLLDSLLDISATDY